MKKIIITLLLSLFFSFSCSISSNNSTIDNGNIIDASIDTNTSNGNDDAGDSDASTSDNDDDDTGSIDAGMNDDDDDNTSDDDDDTGNDDDDTSDDDDDASDDDDDTSGDDDDDNLELPYVIVDTNQTDFYNNNIQISEPPYASNFFGQDAHFTRNAPSYQDNGDGTITDLNTGLMWQKDLLDNQFPFDDAVENATSFNLGEYDDWRLPTIKELYSLIQFSGIDPNTEDDDTSALIPFIDTDYFEFEYGDTSQGVRIIDSQFWSSTEYVSTTMINNATTFGVNFADGRIKGYPTAKGAGGVERVHYVRYVRQNTDYGKNNFIDNDDNTITDVATGLMWTKDDSALGLTWQEALTWVKDKNTESHLGYSDWRLPHAKELQSIVDYSRSPDTTSSAAIDPLFNCTQVQNEGNNDDYPFFWTGTTHVRRQDDTLKGMNAVYLSFGRFSVLLNREHPIMCTRLR